MKNIFLDENQTPTSDDPRRVPIKPRQKKQDTILILKNGRIIDGTGKPAFYGHIVIKNNKIDKILPETEFNWGSEAKIIECSGKTIIPGLIDLHVHLTYTNDWSNSTNALDLCESTLRALERMQYFIESGITSVRDAGSLDTIPFRLKQWVTQNHIIGPRIFAAGNLITSTGGHGAEGLDHHSPLYGTVIERNGPDEWRAAVREQFKKGADFIKTASHFSKAEIKAAVEEAHALGLKITADAERHYILWAVEAGIDMIEHPLPRSEESISLMAEKGVDSIPTLATYDILFDGLEGYHGSTSRRFTFSKEQNMNLCKKMKSAGIKLGIGTDLIVTEYQAYADFYLHELLDFQKLGYSNLEIISIATKINAEILDMDSKLGTLEPGKLADIVILNNEPDKYLENIKNVEHIIRDGHLIVKNGNIRKPRRDQLTYNDFVTKIKDWY